jgi:hypothetical protein
MKNQQRSLQQSLNEWKGCLFEYLVAKSFSVVSHEPSYFQQKIPPAMIETLWSYQKSLYQQHQKLYHCLPLWAEETANAIKGMPQYQEKELWKVWWSGKGKEVLTKKNEADVMLYFSGGTTLLCSLKLSRYASYVNTKNAGVKSFFSRFFSYAWNSYKQKQYEEKLDLLFSQLTWRLYHTVTHHEQEELDASSLSLDQYWQSKGKPLLPGQLDAEERKWVHHWYFEVMSLIYQEIHLIFYDPQWKEELIESWPKLLGREEGELVQVVAFHDGHDGLHLKKIFILEHEFIRRQLNQARLGVLGVGKSYMEIFFPGMILQIRVKPMNHFTVQSLKINCSVKFSSEVVGRVEDL